MSQSKTTSQKRKLTSLEVANQMYKDAFLIKKTRFSEKNPQLSDVELNQMTAKYFREMAEKK